MHILILSDNYYPVPLANSICLRSYIDKFEEYGHKCTIINRLDDGVNIADTHNIHSFNCSKHPYFKAPFKTLYKISQLFVYPHIYNRLVKAYSDKIEEMDLSKVDVIVSVCNPIESVLAALKVKEKYPHIKQVVYDVDTLSDFRLRQIESICCPFWRKLAYKVEKEIFAQADLTIILSSHKGFYSGKKYKAFGDKLLFQEVPLLKIDDTANVSDNGHCIYAGRFYKDFREPSVLLNLFKNTRLPLDIFTTKNYSNSIKKSSQTSANINVSEYIPEEELNEVMKRSGILVSIGNKTSNMFPSKTVTYVSMCKPIIHIFHDNIDPVVDYLKDYPDVLFVDLRNSLAKNRALVSGFCSKEHPQIDAKEVAKRYETSSPKYCATELLNRIKCL